MWNPSGIIPPKAADVNLSILEGRAVYYSQGFLGAMHRNSGETGIPVADLGLFLKDPLRIAPFGDGTRRCSKNGRLMRCRKNQNPFRRVYCTANRFYRRPFARVQEDRDEFSGPLRLAAARAKTMRPRTHILGKPEGRWLATCRRCAHWRPPQPHIRGCPRRARYLPACCR